MESISILGSGWLGLALSECLVQQGAKVKASTRSSNRFGEIQAIGAEAYLADIDLKHTDLSAFLSADILIINITSKNTSGFKQLIAQIASSSIRRVLFVSSTSVYRNSDSPIGESDGLEDDENVLFQIERLFVTNQQFQTTVIRFAGLIGYDRHPGRFFSQRVISAPNAPVNLIHRDDCINIIAKIIDQKLWGEVLNACADSHPSKFDFYTYAACALGLDAPLVNERSRVNHKIISNDKIKNRLRYQFIHADLMALDFKILCSDG